MATWKMKRGDSLWLDVELEAGETINDIDSNWPGTWGGTFTVKANLSDTLPLDSGALVLFDGLDSRPNVPGKFRVAIGRKTENIDILENGVYRLSVEITNETQLFRKEIAQDKLKVSQEGV